MPTTDKEYLHKASNGDENGRNSNSDTIQLKKGGEMRKKKKKKEFDLVFFWKASVGCFWLPS